MGPFGESQLLAFLFKPGGTVEVAVEGLGEPAVFELTNSDAGVGSLTEALVPHRDMNQPPYICVGASPEARLDGPLFQALLEAPIPRHIYALPRYLLFAERMSWSPFSAATLLAAFRSDFPSTTVRG